MTANTFATDLQRWKLRELTLGEIAGIVGANVVRRWLNKIYGVYLADKSELDRYRSDSGLEKSRGLSVVITWPQPRRVP